MKTEINVCYIRIDDLYRNFFIAKHGTPAVFSPSSELESILRSELVNNPLLESLSTSMHLSYNDIAFNYNVKGVAIDANVCKPTDEERAYFVPVVIPEEVRKFSGMMKTSNTWQLNVHGARRFREAVKQEFWREFRNFYSDCMQRAKLNDENIGTEDIVSDFMTIFNIPMSLYENMLRYERRERSSSMCKIEKRRAKYEQITGNSFLYT